MSELSETQRNRIARNRERAIILRNGKLTAHPYAKNKDSAAKDSITTFEKTTIKIGGSTFKDTGGGFLLEEVTRAQEEDLDIKIPEPEPAFLAHEQPLCKNCDKPFCKSWLFTNFDYHACDECKNLEMFKLITKSEATKEYLLKDVDLERREPPLRYIKRRNPHNQHWGDMKLYLQIQVEERALEVWGDEESLAAQHERLEDKRIIAKQTKYNKKMRELRMITRSSLYDRTKAAAHEHVFGAETLVDEEEDMYSRTCTTCGYSETFEKM